jgi:hypothetical protein
MKHGQRKEKDRKLARASAKRPAPPEGRDAEPAGPISDKGRTQAQRSRVSSLMDIKPEPWGEGTEHDSERVDEIVYGVPPRRRQPGR